MELTGWVVDPTVPWCGRSRGADPIKHRTWPLVGFELWGVRSILWESRIPLLLAEAAVVGWHEAMLSWSSVENSELDPVAMAKCSSSSCLLSCVGTHVQGCN